MRSISQMKKDLKYLKNFNNFKSSFGKEQVGSGNIYEKYGIPEPPPPPPPQRRVRRRLNFPDQNQNPNVPRFGSKNKKKFLIRLRNGLFWVVGTVGGYYVIYKASQKYERDYDKRNTGPNNRTQMAEMNKIRALVKYKKPGEFHVEDYMDDEEEPETTPLTHRLTNFGNKKIINTLKNTGKKIWNNKYKIIFFSLLGYSAYKNGQLHGRLEKAYNKLSDYDKKQINIIGKDLDTVLRKLPETANYSDRQFKTFENLVAARIASHGPVLDEITNELENYLKVYHPKTHKQIDEYVKKSQKRDEDDD